MKHLTLTAASLFLALSTAAFAQDAATPAFNPRAMNRIERRLNITPQQREQARAILLQEQPQLQAMRISLAAERKELAASSTNGTFDQAVAHAIAAKYADAHADAAVERVKLRTELVAILTPEQKEKLQQLRTRISAVLGSQLPGFGDTL